VRPYAVYDKCAIIDTGMLIKSCKWSPNGNVIAVAGSLLDGPENNKGVV